MGAVGDRSGPLTRVSHRNRIGQTAEIQRVLTRAALKMFNVEESARGFATATADVGIGLGKGARFQCGEC